MTSSRRDGGSKPRVGKPGRPDLLALLRDMPDEGEAAPVVDQQVRGVGLQDAWDDADSG